MSVRTGKSVAQLNYEASTGVPWTTCKGCLGKTAEHSPRCPVAGTSIEACPTCNYTDNGYCTCECHTKREVIGP